MEAKERAARSRAAADELLKVAKKSTAAARKSRVLAGRARVRADERVSTEDCAQYDGDSRTKRGLCAYAHKQAHWHRARAAANKALWDSMAPEVNAFLKPFEDEKGRFWQ